MQTGLRSDPASWADRRHKDGLAAERRAMAYLRALGWRILAHRFRVARHEIDLIARRDEVVAFIEVKHRSGHRFGRACQSLRWAQQHRLALAAAAWVDRYGVPNEVYRFDVIGVDRARLTHLEDAFRPGWR